MTREKSRTFPLPLSSVVGDDAKRPFLNTARERGLASTQFVSQNKQLIRANEAQAKPAKEPNQRTLLSNKAEPEYVGTLVSGAVRQAMVQRLIEQGIKDEGVLEAISAAPRHIFVDPALASQAYIDASLPIGYGQTISQPYIVARMIEILRADQQSGMLDKVLEIGTGCGYQALVLSKVARDVYSIERIKGLHELAKTRLRPLRVPNIRLHYGDGMLGLPQVAPFDGIILAAAGMEVPQALLEQLAIGGRLVAPVGGEQQVLQLIERMDQNEWRSTMMENCFFVPLLGGRA